MDNTTYAAYIEKIAAQDTHIRDHWYQEGRRLLQTYGYLATQHLCVVKYYCQYYQIERNEQ